ncbi:hypothetical protein CXZ10_17145 [Pleomorphomonas diazotrophica]|uniref:Uncharacterized protein n=1 Tax=Pleomorphomonas diazotrophica TaxID=1166257 RepID=A0A1I4W486_9HYPH|nr:hypothetical protein CXZ10_17145 [Pleomorphomonas diazotrophica]SFN08275.1 hypothetical protein SAMN05192571_1155 [Pleomorphomonas diazotrophica]
MAEAHAEVAPLALLEPSSTKLKHLVVQRRFKVICWSSRFSISLRKPDRQVLQWPFKSMG